MHSDTQRTSSTPDPLRTVPPATGLRARARSVAAAVRRLPFGAALVARVHATVPWRPGVREIPVDRLLLGLQNRVPAEEFAAALGNPMWPSTPVGEGPHAQLLRLAEHDPEITDETILTSPYADLARACIHVRGFFFTATDDGGIVAVARNYLGRHRGHVVEALGEHQSAADSPVRVAPVRWSDCFQMLDGHHRVASAAVAGEPTLTARVKWVPVTTPLQRMVRRASPAGQRVLLQPLNAPDVASWRVDPAGAALPRRAEALLDLMRSQGLGQPGATHLDLACGYGWPVATMTTAGLRSEGVDHDPAACRVGTWAYGVPADRLHAADPVRFLGSADRTWDVVTLLQPERLPLASVGAELARLVGERAVRAVFVGGARLAGDGQGSRLARLLADTDRFEEPVKVAGPDGTSAGEGVVLLRTGRG